MKKKIWRILKEAIFFIITLTIISNIVSLYKSRDLSNQKFDTALFQENINKPTIVHFWATWCPVCKLEASNIELLSKHYNVITVAVKSKDIKSWMKEHNYTYKVIDDRDAKIATKFKIPAFPTTFIYDKDKNLVFKDVGYSSTFSMFLKLLYLKIT